MTKTDLSKEHKQLYNAKTEPALIDVPELNCLMIDGQGDPNSGTEFQEAMGALYALAYTTKFSLKKQDPTKDFKVMMPEALWWNHADGTIDLEHKETWQWTLFLVVPDFVSAEVIAAARDEVRAKKKPVPSLDKVRLERFREGKSVQVMHIGPYADEPASIAKMHQLAADLGLKLRGKHHEIYYSDPRRTKPEKMRTILRQPVG
jgi:hypothetical protein